VPSWTGTVLLHRLLTGEAWPAAHSAATAIRGHWHIEHKLDYTRDVTFQEQQSRIATGGNSPLERSHGKSRATPESEQAEQIRSMNSSQLPGRLLTKDVK
jgi:hypothetical protein